MNDRIVTFPTLGFLIADWVEAHCVVPDGDRRGDPFILYPWQLWDILNHYRLKPSAQRGQLAPAFYFRRTQIVRPQKSGKNPLIAAVICAEACGPVLFDGWADEGDVYRCADFGCDCGWVCEYDQGDPRGRPWSTPLIQITATSAEQTDNTWDVLRPMIDYGPLAALVPHTGEEFIRLPGGGRIDVVTSSATSRLGQRVTFCAQDQTESWFSANRMIKVAETQRRGLAGMGGRAIETGNAWDPSEDSVAQRTAESATRDIFRDHPLAPSGWSYRDKRQRRKVHQFLYADCPHVDLDGIEAEVVELMERDPNQAERYFGNRVLTGQSGWMPADVWNGRAALLTVDAKQQITIGFDGSLGTMRARYKPDATALGACRVDDGHLFTLGIWEATQPDVDGYWCWEPDRADIHATVEDAFSRFDVLQMWADPQHWQNDLGAWAEKYGFDRVLERWTNTDVFMHRELERLRTAIVNGDVTHDGDPRATAHVLNARAFVRRSSRVVDPEGKRDRVLIRKNHPHSPDKIDMAVAWTLAYAARAHCLEKGLNLPKRKPSPLVSHRVKAR